MFPDANGVPDPATRQPFVDGAAGAGRPPDRARRRPLLRRPRRRHDPADPRAHPATTRRRPTRPATPTSGAAAAPGELRRHGVDRPGRRRAHLRLGPRRRRRLRRLDRRRSPASPTRTSGAYTVRLRVTRPWRAQQHRHGHDHGRDAADRRRSPRPTAGTTWKVGDVISFSGSATDGQGGPVPPSGLSWTARPAALLRARADELPRAPHPELQPGAAGSFTCSRPRVSVLPRARADRHRRRACRSTVTRRLDPKTVDLTFETQPAGLEPVGRQRAADRRRSRAR